MFDIGWPELLIVALLLLIVVGPKDLPVVLRTLGRYLGKVRAMGREFTSTLEEVAKEAELDDVVKTANRVRTTNVKNEIERFLDAEPGPDVSKAEMKTDPTSKANEPKEATSPTASLTSTEAMTEAVPSEVKTTPTPEKNT